MVPVQSTYLRAAGYEREHSRLWVAFVSGETRAYSPVAEEKFLLLLAAESRGRYFSKEIQDCIDPEIIIQRSPAIPTPSLNAATDTVVATPVYLALLRLRQRAKKTPANRFKYTLWLVTGNEPQEKLLSADSLYYRCLQVLLEAGGDTYASVEAAIALARERKI